jgi:sec-independent protein translocase protein TatC
MTTRTPTELDVVGHLDELRTRILIGLLALAVGAVVGWVVYPWVFDALADPVRHSVTAHGGQLILSDPSAAFLVRVKLAVVVGLVLASPVLLGQAWGFMKPGLHPHERKAVAPLLPAVCALFLIGAAVAYATLRPVMAFFLAFQPAGVALLVDFEHALNLPLALILAFGLAFQLPIVLLGLVLLHVISPQGLLTHWRTALVVIAVLSAVITPSQDAFSMLLMLVPLALLYFATVLVAFRLRGGEAQP